MKKDMAMDEHMGEDHLFSALGFLADAAKFGAKNPEEALDDALSSLCEYHRLDTSEGEEEATTDSPDVHIANAVAALSDVIQSKAFRYEGHDTPRSLAAAVRSINLAKNAFQNATHSDDFEDIVFMIRSARASLCAVDLSAAASSISLARGHVDKLMPSCGDEAASFLVDADCFLESAAAISHYEGEDDKTLAHRCQAFLDSATLPLSKAAESMPTRYRHPRELIRLLSRPQLSPMEVDDGQS